MIRRPPRSTPLSLHDALPICGPRSLPVRQQTLRRTIQWSYDLLGPEEQSLFHLLSVFVDGWTDRKRKRLNSSHLEIPYPAFSLKKKTKGQPPRIGRGSMS